MTIAIAHFSDFHLENTKLEFRRALALIDDAFNQGAEHIVISGDIVDGQQIKVVREFVSELDSRSFLSADRSTIVPGNHDVFPNLGFRIPRRPTGVFKEFVEITKASRRGNDSAELIRGAPYPFGKVLSEQAVLVGLDTTRNGKHDPREWTAGELPKEHVDAVERFFSEHSEALHRVVVMHHYPYRCNFVGGNTFNQNFIEPEADTVREWLRAAGATLVLCGHVHVDPKDRAMGDGVRLLRNGTAGGKDAPDGDDGTAVRSYALVALDDEGGVSVEQRVVTGGQLDGKADPQHEADWLDK